jgi:hypothetical protein
VAAGGKSSGSTSSGFGDVLASIAGQINHETDPVRRQYLNQLQQVLGGNQFTTSTIPLIQSGVQAARSAAGSSLQQSQAALAQSGAAQSPFAAAIQSMIGQQGNQAIASVPQNVAANYEGQVGGAVQGIGGQALSGLASAAQTNYGTNSSNNQWGVFNNLFG